MKKSARRSRGSGSIFKKNGVFYYQWQTPDGLRHQKRIVDAMGRSITERVEALKAVKQLIEDVQTTHRIASKIDYLHEIAEARKLLPANRVSVDGMWESYLKSPCRPDSSSGTLDFYHDAVLPFQKWMKARHGEIVEVRDITEEIAGEYATEFWQSGISERTYNVFAFDFQGHCEKTVLPTAGVSDQAMPFDRGACRERQLVVAVASYRLETENLYRGTRFFNKLQSRTNHLGLVENQNGFLGKIIADVPKMIFRYLIFLENQ